MGVRPVAVLHDVGDPFDLSRAQKLLDLSQVLPGSGFVRLAAGQNREDDGPRRCHGS